MNKEDRDREVAPTECNMSEVALLAPTYERLQFDESVESML
ncbi:MAG: hypothetical protein OXD54_13740 [Candidatus Poribacteria bacterium]|nr:hypothetical protein [Candidatus Poribacteria bacterium]